ncbi:MAG TPA: AAA family ATPase [Balneolaceae bacterium]
MKAKLNIISIVSPFGGTGKTTLVFELGKAFVSINQRVLLVDLDPKSDLTSIAGIEPDPKYLSMAEVLLRETTMHNTLANVGDFTVAISSSNLSAAEGRLKQVDGIIRLKEALEEVSPMFDLVIVDCPPNLGRLTQNAIVASDLTLTPVLEDLNIENSVISVNEAVNSVRQQFNTNLTKLKIVRVYDDKDHDDKNVQIINEISEKYSDQVLKTTIAQLSRIREGYQQGQLEMNMVSTDEIVELSKELLDEMRV